MGIQGVLQELINSNMVLIGTDYKLKTWSKNKDEQIKELKDDFNLTTGSTLSKGFICPFTYTYTEDTSWGHILPEKLFNTNRSKIMQWSSIDSWYGSYFESGFINATELINLEHKVGKENVILSVLNNKKLFKAANKEANIKGIKGTPYKKKNDQHLYFRFTTSGIEKDKLDSIKQAVSINISIDFDYSIHELVSLIKAASLTMFYKFGYACIYSVPFVFIGQEYIGKFYLNNHYLMKKERDTILQNSKIIFKDITNTIGTLNDEPHFTESAFILENNLFYICANNNTMWGWMFLFKIHNKVRFVILPAFDDKYGMYAYNQYLKTGIGIDKLYLCEITELGIDYIGTYNILY